MKTMLEKFRDTTARKPSGWLGKRLYEDPKAHRESFRLILEKLDLKSDDSYLEVACGGGVLLEMALRTVSRGAAIDHSADMVELAMERNKAALERGTAEVVEGNAESLPWPDESFSCAACASAFFFFEHPELVLSEISRVLEPNGRLVFTTCSGKTSLIGLLFKWPYNLKTYPDEKMERMLYSAGFSVVEVDTVSGIQVWMAQKAES
ncbi:methyltransferase domain-containing protein [Prosthecochloris sp. SCSIO W1101]|uniref:class I SAM-dependent methyltransferase n=1 Tax=Prosthecochloris sp. SCSIO W1101 TaxID=2992242 RepID=UPI00223CF1E1|nr:methyltransferase domain-containing protein [Prosthecochloris sp. SCSIO W1101]UZJ41303.1 methyltransferase domain-containing protein [Prosthecochloris sp. SCSIO W1101]